MILITSLVPLDMAQFKLKEPLQFAVLDAQGILLLARGHVIASAEQLQRLVDRGAYANAEELAALSHPPVTAVVSTHGKVVARLRLICATLGPFLQEPDQCMHLGADIDACVRWVTDLLTAYPDCTLFNLMRGSYDANVGYSLAHAVQCAAACHLVAGRLEWTTTQRDSLVSAALTMNVGMTQLHSDLAAQLTPPTLAQREVIAGHPAASTAILEQHGVKDRNWLRCVEEHHETADATGYPRGIASTFVPADVVRHTDVFMALAKGRATREAVYPNETMREFFLSNRRSDIAAALIKEFGLYPPATVVRLANKALAVVVARGADMSKPIAAELDVASGEGLLTPIRRDTSDPKFEITGIVQAKSVAVEIDPERLYP
jgi:HD-GYP domain-containing protein (c-di-GMP phosphodiesterase class II)